MDGCGILLVFEMGWASLLSGVGKTCGCSSVVDEAEYKLSAGLERSSRCMVPETTMYKSVFQEVDVEPLAPVVGHTHGCSAAARSTASLLIDRVCDSSALTPEFFQGSSSDQRKGRETSRYHVWAKDLMARAQPRSKEADATVMVDVDYYIDDLESRLCDSFRPHLLYTFVPSRASRDDGEYKYTFHADGRVTYTVAGGGTYEHKLWDWDGDSLCVKRSILGIPWWYATYAIERRFVDEDHQVILLSPLRKWAGVFSWIARCKLRGKSMSRLNPVCGEFTRLKVNKGDGLLISTSKLGGYCCATVPVRVDDALSSAVKTMSGKPTMGTVKSKMDDNDYNVVAKHRGAEILLEFHVSGGLHQAQVSITDGVRRFQWIPPGGTIDEDAKPGMVPFMEPLLNGGFVPDVCKNNDENFVAKRVKEVRSNRKMTPFLSQLVDEFVREFIPDPLRHTFYPVEETEVYQRQAKPSQRRILDASQHESRTDVTVQFAKKEAYPRVNDVRGISQINGVDKREYSAFIYALAEHIKTQDWYAFGKSPIEIARRVALICENSEWVDNMDFSRMDGRVSEAVRELERRVMMRAFAPVYHVSLYQLMRNQFGLRAKTTHGVSHTTMFERLSGSAETSAFNTLLTAFVNFAAYRMTRDVCGGRPSPAEAYASLGIYGGDDGLSGGLSRDAATRASALVGQVLDLERVHRNDGLGVKFLARHYGPDVWFGCPDSICDIRRQLSKFHLTVHLPSNISWHRKLQEKAFAYSLSDKNTPVIGEFVRKVLQLYPLTRDQFTNVIGLWIPELDEGKQYPNGDAGDWMEDYVRSQLTDFDLEGFRDWIRRANNQTIRTPEYAAPDVPVAIKPGALVLVDGDLHGIATSTDTPAPVKTGEAPAKTRFRARKPRSDRSGTPARDTQQSRIHGRNSVAIHQKTSPATRGDEPRPARKRAGKSARRTTKSPKDSQ